jgi:hypothetical protein
MSFNDAASTTKILRRPVRMKDKYKYRIGVNLGDGQEME